MTEEQFEELGELFDYDLIVDEDNQKIYMLTADDRKDGFEKVYGYLIYNNLLPLIG